MKPHLLYLAGHLPAANATQAGMKSSYHLCRILARHYEIHCLSFVSGNETFVHKPEGSDIFASQELVPVTHSQRLLGALMAPSLPAAIGARNSVGFRRRLINLASSQQFDVAILDHTAMWQYAQNLQGVPVICGVAHDVLSQQWDRRAIFGKNIISRFLLRTELARMRRWEASAVRQLAMCVSFSEKDSKLLLQLDPRHLPVTIQPWFVNFADRKVCRRKGNEKNILFWGALNRTENQDCVRFILERILPLVHRSIPDAHFYIVGVASDSLKRAWTTPKVTVTGFVDNIGELFAQMDVALLPLRLGAGIKIKVLETMSAGIPVVTSSVGIEGIPARAGSEYLLGNSAEDYAAHTISLLENREVAEVIGSRGARFIRENFDFDKAAEKFAQVLHTYIH